MSKCERCGYDDRGTGDFSHYCPPMNPNAKFAIAPAAGEQGSAIPSFMQHEIDQAIESALHPKGMSVHDGKVVIQVTTLQYLMRMIAPKVQEK